jgi:UDP-N-acetyl-D-glucosamine/UDP-N-acetyl-D-galactosamine dehydrogenase
MKGNLVAVVGLGYVGLPLAISFSKKVKTIGFDVNQKKIIDLKNSIDPNDELNKEDFDDAGDISFTSSPQELSKARYVIVAVPTPVDDKKFPDMTILKNACLLIGKNISPETIIVFESTVYPGVTEDICIPILEASSELENNKDGFMVGYSPERINPGDKNRKLEDIIKIVSGQNEEVANEIYDLYNQIIAAGLHKTPNIKTAEASKVIENAQRDINIAFMNELSVVFDKMGIDTLDVLEAAKTKWNFTPFTPGLVGGHCIGIDPYYLTYKSQMVGHEAKLILTARNINESMARGIVDKLNTLLPKGKIFNEIKIGVFGVTFKENCSDFRNSKIIDLIRELKSEGYDCKVHDPKVNHEELAKEHNLAITPLEQMKNLDAIILAAGHDEYTSLPVSFFEEINSKLILLDLKGMYKRELFTETKIKIWRM